MGEGEVGFRSSLGRGLDQSDFSADDCTSGERLEWFRFGFGDPAHLFTIGRIHLGQFLGDDDRNAIVFG